MISASPFLLIWKFFAIDRNFCIGKPGLRQGLNITVSWGIWNIQSTWDIVFHWSYITVLQQQSLQIGSSFCSKLGCSAKIFSSPYHLSKCLGKNSVPFVELEPPWLHWLDSPLTKDSFGCFLHCFRREPKLVKSVLRWLVPKAAEQASVIHFAGSRFHGNFKVKIGTNNWWWLKIFDFQLRCKKSGCKQWDQLPLVLVQDFSHQQ